MADLRESPQTKLPVIGRTMTCWSVEQAMRQLIANKDYVVTDRVCGHGFPSSSAYLTQDEANTSWQDNRLVILNIFRRDGRVVVQSLESSIIQG